ncbi:Spermidine/putrescine-binding periplasmic protein precursor [Gimesia alba]|uniref:Spermidine/putrescine-binding periplasmic protein n=1 Tax=Gimesia alba TaxID=2527973 RepID=A0A517RHX4_9PLAN|nr:ABC transporter substrate-binding protein [Gimesia alba]QDT43474.1 Spermidine/putrescine-binding periplasmic protein precursor [Gimesia alba]
MYSAFKFDKAYTKFSLIIWMTSIFVGLMNGCNECPDEQMNPENQSLTVVSYGGGAYQKSHQIAFCEPFTKYTGRPINSVSWNAEYGKLKSMVASGNVKWNVVEVTAAQFARGKSEGLFEKLTLKPAEGDFLFKSIDDYGIANVYWGTVMAYNSDAFPNKKPQTWRDFFDVKSFPGDRALYDDPRGNLEFALLADGVAIEDLYPIDVDRAFKKLDTIKKEVRVWWSDGTQPVQLLLTNTVQLTSAWNGRIFALETNKDQIGFSWDGAGLELDYWVIPRGAANVSASSRFINFASSAYPLAQQVQMIGYGPVNKKSISLIPKAVAKQLPTYESNWNKAFVVNAEWWSENEEAVKTRWVAWKNQ